MPWRKTARAAALAIAFACPAFASSGCGGETDATSFSMGTVTIRWSINGLVDPNLCFQAAADTLRVQVFDEGGTFVSEYVSPCETFGTTLTLGMARYQANARLEGPTGPRTTTVAILPFMIEPGVNLNVQIDFPASSFF